MDISDMKPDFDKMTKAELRAYIVAHPSDDEAFYKFVDRFKADPNSPGWQPFPKTPEEFAKIPQIIQEHIKKLEENK